MKTLFASTDRRASLVPGAAVILEQYRRVKLLPSTQLDFSPTVGPPLRMSIVIGPRARSPSPRSCVHVSAFECREVCVLNFSVCKNSCKISRLVYLTKNCHKSCSVSFPLFLPSPLRRAPNPLHIPLSWSSLLAHCSFSLLLSLPSCLLAMVFFSCVFFFYMFC